MKNFKYDGVKYYLTEQYINDIMDAYGVDLSVMSNEQIIHFMIDNKLLRIV